MSMFRWFPYSMLCIILAFISMVWKLAVVKEPDGFRGSFIVPVKDCTDGHDEMKTCGQGADEAAFYRTSSANGPDKSQGVLALIQACFFSIRPCFVSQLLTVNATWTRVWVPAGWFCSQQSGFKDFCLQLSFRLHQNMQQQGGRRCLTMLVWTSNALMMISLTDKECRGK